MKSWMVCLLALIPLVLGARLVPPARTFAELAREAYRAQINYFYIQGGSWQLCDPDICGHYNIDWGADSLTYDLYFYGQTSGKPAASLLRTLAAGQPAYTPQRESWSDIPEWDAVAQARAFQVSGDAHALAKARAAFAYIDQRSEFAQGACPGLNYQAYKGGDNLLKTLETDSNYIKAGLLLFELTGESDYLDRARRKYEQVRLYHLDARWPLYTVYVFDDGRKCTQVPGRFFASVNGNMIWSGIHLARATGVSTYLDQALASAQAVNDQLSDASGIFVDLQAENDVVEPLVEAMFELATQDHQASARDWILRNAAATVGTRRWNGTYGRFFNGPPPARAVSAWEANGGAALMYAAAALAPDQVPVSGYWSKSAHVTKDLLVKKQAKSFSFTGRAIAIHGTIGENCCESGHARVFVDGVETVSTVGVWQNKSSPGRALPDSILFAWRWPASGTHTIEIRPGEFNKKEGVSFFHMTGYELVP